MTRSIIQIMLKTGTRSQEIIRISNDNLKGSTLFIIVITKTKLKTIPLNILVPWNCDYIATKETFKGKLVHNAI